MKNIVMLGCENSHVNTFLNIMQEDPDKYRDINVIGLFDDDKLIARHLEEHLQKRC